MKKEESPSDVASWLAAELTGLVPAGLGSLSLRRTRCIRKNCYACETGERHSSYVLYGQKNGKRYSVYVPDELAGDVRKMIKNGRRVEELLFEASRRYTAALKAERHRAK